MGAFVDQSKPVVLKMLSIDFSLFLLLISVQYCIVNIMTLLGIVLIFLFFILNLFLNKKHLQKILVFHVFNSNFRPNMKNTFF